MKTLQPIVVGAYPVSITVEDHGVTSLLFTASCGETKWTGSMNVDAKHDHSPEQFQKDVADFANRLAIEAAGREHSRKLKESIRG